MKTHSLADVILKNLSTLGAIYLDAFFPAKYSYASIWRPLLGLEHPPKITRHTVSMNLWRLQKQGLVRRSGNRKRSLWSLTPAGRRRLQSRFRGVQDSEISVPAKDGITRIVIFDIPEYHRKKRDTIRTELIGCDFRQLQKSVWMGENPLPKSFVDIIHELELTQNVHIFSVRERGTVSSQSE